MVVLDLPREKLDRVQVVNRNGTIEVVKGNGDQWQKKDNPTWQADEARFGRCLVLSAG